MRNIRSILIPSMNCNWNTVAINKGLDLSYANKIFQITMIILLHLIANIMVLIPIYEPMVIFFNVAMTQKLNV